MESSEVAEFRQRFRYTLCERLALQTALIVRRSALGLSIEEAAHALKDWLDANTASADQKYGEHFRDPGLTALYAEEVHEIIAELKAQVDKMAEQAASWGMR
jgi:hypothetical protein